MDFAQALRAGDRRAAAGARAATSQAGHIGSGAPASAAARRRRAALRDAGQTNLDRNTVDMDRERASFADNAVKYEATLRFINGSVRTMLSRDHRPVRSAAP